jgi:hypothetical protein
MKKRWGFICCLPIALVLACSGQAPDQEVVGEEAQSLMAGDEAIICLPGDWIASEQQACEDRSGVMQFDIGECRMKVGRKCQLVPIDGGFECKCKVKIIEANDRCDDVRWVDLGVSKC